MRIILKRIGRSAFAPADDATVLALQGVAVNDTFDADVRPIKGRSLRQLRLWWAMCGMLAEAVGVDKAGNNLTRDNVSALLKIRSGHCDIVQGKNETFRIPRSIAFDAMPQPAFNELMSTAVRVVCEDWLPHMKPSELRKIVEGMVAGGREAA